MPIYNKYLLFAEKRLDAEIVNVNLVSYAQVLVSSKKG
jgi:hypothetical protein